MGIRGTISGVKEQKIRDPLNTAVAEILNEAYINKGSRLSWLVKESGVARSTVVRYLDGTRDIRVAELRKIADVLGLTMSQILIKAERSIE